MILISAFLLIGLAGLLLFAAWRDEGEFVRVTVDGTVFGEYPLDRDDVIDIETGEGTNTLTIVDGQADMTEADCPDKICVDHIAISRAGESPEKAGKIRIRDMMGLLVDRRTEGSSVFFCFNLCTFQNTP